MKPLLILASLLMSLSVVAACEEISSEFKVTDPAYKDEFTVKLKTYKANASDAYIFIFPPIVGETVLDKRTAASFCGQNLNAIIINAVREIPFEEEAKDLSVHDLSYARAAASLAPVIESIKARTQGARFGVLGTSLGGMLATFIAGTFPEIKASVIIVGAGNVPGVLAYSDQEFVKKQREERMRTLKLQTAAEYEELLKGLVPNDPINVAPMIAPKSTYLFIATADTTVPTKYQQELRRAIREPLVFEMSGNHLNGIVKAGTVHLRKIIGFFKNRLN